MLAWTSLDGAFAQPLQSSNSGTSSTPSNPSYREEELRAMANVESESHQDRSTASSHSRQQLSGSPGTAFGQRSWSQARMRAVEAWQADSEQKRRGKGRAVSEPRQVSYKGQQHCFMSKVFANLAEMERLHAQPSANVLTHSRSASGFAALPPSADRMRRWDGAPAFGVRSSLSLSTHLAAASPPNSVPSTEAPASSVRHRLSPFGVWSPPSLAPQLRASSPLSSVPAAEAPAPSVQHRLPSPRLLFASPPFRLDVGHGARNLTTRPH